jgi:hypothetical protein
VGPAEQRSTVGHTIAYNECVSVRGSVSWRQQGFDADGSQDVAEQDDFVFADADAASTAYAAVLGGMEGCQSASRTLQVANSVTPDATSSRTAATPDASAWMRSWNGVEGASAPGPQVNHYYFVLHADTLTAVTFTTYAGGSAGLDSAGSDSHVLAGLVTALA